MWERSFPPLHLLIFFFRLFPFGAGAWAHTNKALKRTWCCNHLYQREIEEICKSYLWCSCSIYRVLMFKFCSRTLILLPRRTNMDSFCPPDPTPNDSPAEEETAACWALLRIEVSRVASPDYAAVENSWLGKLVSPITGGAANGRTGSEVSVMSIRGGMVGWITGSTFSDSNILDVDFVLSIPGSWLSKSGFNPSPVSYTHLTLPTKRIV